MFSSRTLLLTLSRTPVLSQRSLSKWMDRHVKDKFVKESRYQNYRARSAFKLIQIDDQHRLLKPGMIVVECGAAPGSWTQVLVERLCLKPPNAHKTGAVIAIDINNFHPVDGAICLPNTDFTSTLSQAKILNALNGKKVDLIASDMSPSVTGQHDFDHECILQLVYSAFQFATVCLKKNGCLLVKIFNGSHTEQLSLQLKNFFDSVKFVKPQASRADSTEIYILCKDFKGLEAQ